MAKILGEDVVIRSVESALEGKATDLEHCPNCGSDQVDRYCAACGQRAGDLHTTVGQFVRDALDGLFSFDSRLWRTFIALLWRPGFLTVEYWQGRRASYVAPLRLYLFVSFFTFLLLALVGQGDFVDTSGEDTNAPVRILVSEGEQEQPDGSGGADPGWFIREVLMPIAEDPERSEDLFGRRLPWMLFALLPVFAALLRLLYRRRQRFYVPHLVFALHFQTVAFLLFLVGEVASLLWVPASAVTVLLSLLALFLSLRRAYGEGIIKTVAKQACLLFIHLVAISIGMGVLLLMTGLTL